MKPGTFTSPEAAARLRIRFRWVQYPAAGVTVPLTVNAWRVTFWINWQNPPRLDGVDLIAPSSNMTTPRDLQPQPLVLGGAYQPDGTPLYINQTIALQTGAGSGPTQAMLVVEEYHEQQSRQNR